MGKRKNLAKLLDCIYKEEKAFRDLIEKGAIDLLKANGLTEFTFNPKIEVSNTEDFSNDGYAYRVFLVRNPDDTQDMLGIEAAWKSTLYEFPKGYYTTKFYLEDLVQIVTQLYSQLN